MDIRLDKDSPIPVGVQVKEQIKMLVDSGTYKPGDKLPSINQLAASLSVNKNTVVQVLKDLENEGYVESFRGKGVFISLNVPDNAIDREFLGKVDQLIGEARKRGMNTSGLVNLINARFGQVPSMGRTVRALFITGISRELVDVNIQKLKQNISGVEFDGLCLGKNLTRDKLLAAFKQTDLIIVPAMVHEQIKAYLPVNKPVIKTMPNLKLLGSLKKGTDKKSRVAVISITQAGAKALADMFTEARLFKPRLVLPLNELERFRKELKEMDAFVICLSAREAVERLKLKDKEVYFFSDYIDDDSINEIRQSIKKL